MQSLFSKVIFFVIFLTWGCTFTFADTARDLFINKPRWDLTFNNVPDNVYEKIEVEIAKIIEQLDKIDALVPRKALVDFCDELGCPIDTVECNAVYSPVICPNGGTLNDELDKCVLPAATDCPEEYEPNADYTFCQMPPLCNDGYTYESDNDECISLTISESNPSEMTICPDPAMSLEEGDTQCCYPEESASPVTSVGCEEGVLEGPLSTSCPDGGDLVGIMCEKTCLKSREIQCEYIISEFSLEDELFFCTDLVNDDEKCPSYWSNTDACQGSFTYSIEEDCSYPASEEALAGTTCKKTCIEAPVCTNGGELTNYIEYTNTNTVTVTHELNMACSVGRYDEATGLCVYGGLFQVVLHKDITDYNEEQWRNAIEYWRNDFSSPPTFHNIKAFVNSAKLNNEPYICGREINDERTLEVVSAFVWHLGRCPGFGEAEQAGYDYWIDKDTWSIEQFISGAAEECQRRGACPYTPPLVDTSPLDNDNECSAGYQYDAFIDKCQMSKSVCPDGFIPTDGAEAANGECKRLSNDTAICDKTCYSSSTISTCPSGGSLVGAICDKTCYSTTYSCPSGGSRSGSTCYISSSRAATRNTIYTSCEIKYKVVGTSAWSTFPSSFTFSATPSNGCVAKINSLTVPPGATITSIAVNGSEYYYKNSSRAVTTYSCPSGYSLSGTTCTKETSYSATRTTTSYSCDYAAVDKTIITPYVCSYAPTTDGYDYDCYDEPVETKECPEDDQSLEGGQCVSSDCMDPESDQTCPTNSTNAECTGDFPNVYLLDVYKNHFCRCPTQVEYNEQIEKIYNGISFEEVKNELEFSSEEWRGSCSVLDDSNDSVVCGKDMEDKEITSVYKNHLCRCASQTEYDYWKMVKNNGKSQSWVYSAIYNLHLSLGNWQESCPSQEVEVDTCYSAVPVTHPISCPTNTTHVNNNTISYNDENKQCESDILITCGNEENTDYSYNVEEKICTIEPSCPEGNIYNASYDACIDHVTCPLGDDIECNGPLDNAHCSPWACNSINRCGYAYCDEGTPSQNAPYMPRQYFDNFKNEFSGTCNGPLCDLVVNENVTYCETQACPTGFGTFEQNGACYIETCPVGSQQRADGSCYTEECPAGTTEQADGSCLAE